MADRLLYRHEADLIEVAVDASTGIEVGDLLYLDTDDAKPFSSQTDSGWLTGNQATAASKFLGVATQRHRATTDQAGTIVVKTRGVFEFDCASATFEIGDKVGPCENAGGTALEDQKVVKTSYTGLAIGRVARRRAVAATTVFVEIISTVMHGGVQGQTASGVSVP